MLLSESASLYALLFASINIYSVYSIYFGVGHFNFIQGYMLYVAFAGQLSQFAKQFLHRPLWCWDQSKIEVGRTVIAGNIKSVVSLFHN